MTLLDTESMTVYRLHSHCKEVQYQRIDRRPLNWNLITRPFSRRGKSYISPIRGINSLSGYAEVTKQIKWRIEEERKSEGFAVIAKIKAERTNSE